MRPRAGLIRPPAVSQDWRKPLGNEKSQTFADYRRTLEIAYRMFSVNLDEAIGLWRYGRRMEACEVLGVAPALCRRLASGLRALLAAMQEHAKHFGTTPNLVPLDPENFQHTRSQRVALFNDLFSKILLTRRSQLGYKMSALAGLVEELDCSYGMTTEELREEPSLRPERDWELLDCVHYDLNTCLRETVVVFKSFLHALPDAQLGDFESDLQQRSSAGSRAPMRERHLAHRRMAVLKGQ